jgi:hypothetical protein
MAIDASSWRNFSTDCRATLVGRDTSPLVRDTGWNFELSALGGDPDVISPHADPIRAECLSKPQTGSGL